jgi:AraC-like DNA-binding protein
MAESGTAVFTNPGDYGAGISDASLDLVFTEQGEFNGHLTWLKLDNFHIFRSRENIPHIAYMSLAPNRTFVSFPLTASAQVWNGVELQLGDIVLHSPGERGHLWIRGASHWGLISLPSAQLAYYCKTLTELVLTEQPVARILRPQPSTAVQLRRLHSRACTIAEKKPELFARGEAARAVEQDFIQALVDCLSTAVGDRRPVVRQVEIMGRFENMLRGDFEKQPSTFEICAATGVPERTLRKCCVKFLGLSPSRYILLRRLNLVRARLQRADPATATVAEVAFRYHFSELGRFAADYRALFGETPSETLKKASANYAGIA